MKDWLRRLFGRKSERKALEEFSKRFAEFRELEQRQFSEPCDCPACKPVPVLMIDGKPVSNPSRELLEDIVRWNEVIMRTSAERMQRASRRAQ